MKYDAAIKERGGSVRIRREQFPRCVVSKQSKRRTLCTTSSHFNKTKTKECTHMDLDLLIYGYIISGTDQKKLVTVAASAVAGEGDWGKEQREGLSPCALLNTLTFILRTYITYSQDWHSNIFRILTFSLNGLHTQTGTETGVWKG